MQEFIANVNLSPRVEPKIKDTSRVIRMICDYDPLYSGFETLSIDVADVDMKTCDYRNVRRYQYIRKTDGTPLCDWYEVKIKSQGGTR